MWCSDLAVTIGLAVLPDRLMVCAMSEICANYSTDFVLCGLDTVVNLLGSVASREGKVLYQGAILGRPGPWDI